MQVGGWWFKSNQTGFYVIRITINSMGEPSRPRGPPTFQLQTAFLRKDKCHRGHVSSMSP